MKNRKIKKNKPQPQNKKARNFILSPAVCGIWRNRRKQRNHIKFTLNAQTFNPPFFVYCLLIAKFSHSKNKSKCFFKKSFSYQLARFSHQKLIKK